MKKSDAPIEVVQTFEVPITRLWDAITAQPQMIQWFFDNIEAFEPVEGFESRFVVENEGRIFPHLWKITQVDPPRMISYNWKYEGYPGDSFVTFELTETGRSTKLQLIHTVTEDFPDNIPEFTRESCMGGWTYFIHERLKEYLA